MADTSARPGGRSHPDGPTGRAARPNQGAAVLAFFSLGVPELLILLAIGGLVFGGPVVALLVVLLVLRPGQRGDEEGGPGEGR